MMYDAILFDLDGTLLPMDNDSFISGYSRLLGQVAVKCGYSVEPFLAAVWKGVGAMVKNDGHCLNSEVFWKTIAEILGVEIYEKQAVFDDFYNHEFHQTKQFTAFNPLAKEAVELARTKANKVILATSPLFPTNAVHARLNWTGLSPEDFDWITDYENSRTCKPNPAYYAEIAEKFQLVPEKCLMIGNNVQEDIEASQPLGMSSFLVTDCLINHGGHPDCPQGSFQELVAFLKGIE